jgi:hypothetical protein
VITWKIAKSLYYTTTTFTTKVCNALEIVQILQGQDKKMEIYLGESFEEKKLRKELSYNLFKKFRKKSVSFFFHLGQSETIKF